MNARILTTASLLSAFAGLLPAADPQLLNLVMPDAKVLGDVNVSMAKATPFGQYVLSQLQNQDLTTVSALIGFDPRQDVTELVVASNGMTDTKTGIAVASGKFDVAKITAVAVAQNAGQTMYKGVNILSDPNKTCGIAFLSTSLMVAGDVANVKGAIDRQSTPQPLPASLTALAQQLSTTEDAWIVSTVSPAALLTPIASGAASGMAKQPVFQQVQNAQLGVKFGANIVVTAKATADNAADATSLANLVQLFANLAQMQSAQNTDAAALAKSITVAATGVTVNISMSLPQDQFESLVKPTPKAHARH